MCPQCQVLATEVASLEAELKRVREQLAAAKKTSATSSKPPSSDIVKPKPPERSDGQKRSIGGQPGHVKHEREPFTPEQVTKFETHSLEACPSCGGTLRLNPTNPRVVQQVDIETTPLTIEQHTCPEYWCDCCRMPFWASPPLKIERGGLVGPHLMALIAFMKGGCHASFSTIRTFLRDCVGVTLARSTLANAIRKVSEALDGPYDELLRLLPDESVLNIDETGHKCNKDLWWTWCLRADLYTVFKIDPHRSADVLMDLLGRDFEGTIGCDYFSAYRRFMRECDITIQFCLAHLIRDVKFLTTLPDAATKAYGERLRQGLKGLFAVIHRRDELSAVDFERQLNAARDVVLNAGMTDVPPTREAKNMANRFRNHGAAFFTFITTPEVDPTNNRAEQAIRFVVIDRHITQGTRSETGRRWSERIWTTIATCAGQGRSVFGYLKESVENWFNGLPSPSLLPLETPT
ncbi:IS66 family transposase [Singulisphaera sp. GP187]|uniref:IS66 family transposase n=1 Tax=Singulisphaera sp. GP187 TaxID=1882752 RepID=UPI000940AC8A|nr:IS66 family transposase [Singulisphaera sp. GP187]